MDAPSSSPASPPLQVLAALTGRALVSGSSASLLSSLALAWGGHRDCASLLAPINAVSHWVWRDEALCQQGASWRYSVPGYAIHHAMSVFWAGVYEVVVPAREGAGRPTQPGVLRALGTGLGVSALACLVDLRLTPERLTPGFERRLGPGALAAVYVLFGIGLALPRLLRRRPG